MAFCRLPVALLLSLNPALMFTLAHGPRDQRLELSWAVLEIRVSLREILTWTFIGTRSPNYNSTYKAPYVL